MNTALSKDGTRIAYDLLGAGPALILVGGMFEQVAFDSETSQLATLPLLAEHFSIYHYDRRGRGPSGDTLPYAVEREIEDIEILIDAAGGSAFVFGISSGAALALEAALTLGNKIKKVAAYDPAYNDDAAARQAWREFREQLSHVLATGERGKAVDLFMSLLGVPAEALAEMHNYPIWPHFEAVAHTIAYDAAILGEEAAVPRERLAQISIPTLLINGEESYPFMHESAQTIAKLLPNAQYRVLAGQKHEVEAAAIAPLLIEFFS